MGLYHAFGLAIESDIQLNAEMSVNAQPDVKVKLANLAEENRKVINTNQENHIIGTLPGVADISIKDGAEILIDPKPGIDATILSPYILGSAMSVLLQQRGLLVLHASCIVVDGMAIAFLGNSGDGKSTICGAFHARGYEMLTDDVMAISIEKNDVRVIPSVPQIKLRSDSADLMNYSGGSLSPLHPLTKKKVHQVRSGFSTQSISLKQIYVLVKGEQNQIQALSTQDGFIELIRHTRAVKTLQSQNLDRAHFHKCAAIVQKIAISKLIRKFALTELPNLIDLIEKHTNDKSIAAVK